MPGACLASPAPVLYPAKELAMPKTSNEGPSYAGLVDVSPPETVTPEWVPTDSDEAKAAQQVDEPKQDKPKAAVSRETTPPKPSAKSDDSRAKKGRA
jgi:hypothetical protein